MSGKYQPLADYLAAQPDDAVTLTHAEIAAILGAPLPKVAYTRTWWTQAPDATRQHMRVWRAAGWQVVATDRLRGTVTFRRTARQ